VSIRARIEALEREAEASAPTPLVSALQAAYRAAAQGLDVELSPRLSAEDRRLVLGLVGALDALPLITMRAVEASLTR
jgi:ribosomal protein S3